MPRYIHLLVDQSGDVISDAILEAQEIVTELQFKWKCSFCMVSEAWALYDGQVLEKYWLSILPGDGECWAYDFDNAYDMMDFARWLLREETTNALAYS